MKRITGNDREIIRDLARQVKACAELPVMEARRVKWYAHNDLQTTDPIVAVFPEMAWHEIIPAHSLRCEEENARKIEWLLRGRLFRGLEMDDDIPIEKTWEVRKIISDTGWDRLNPNHKNQTFGNEDYRDSCLGSVPLVWKKDFVFEDKAMHFTPIIVEPSDLSRLRAPQIEYLEKESIEQLRIEEEVLGDILEVQLSGIKFIYGGLMQTYSDFRGLEQVLYDLYDEPEMLHEAMFMVEEGYHKLLDQYIALDLLEVNNRQGYNGSGGMNYTHDLPKLPGGGKELQNFWGFTESQEFTMVGPEMHYDFVIQHEQRISERFGLSSYGCCEPIENKLKYILNFNNIRRISVSPWADIQSCSDQIKKQAVYSWKPNPSYFINNYEVDNETFMTGYLKDMLQITRDNCAELVLKDTHTCHHKPEKYRAWVKLARKCIEETR
ncbi:MAG: hypothetical protein ACK5MN_00195 [Lachnospiraceae bacterium]